MKCKVCGGTGTSNTCVNGIFKPCTFCDGTGEYEPFDADIELDKLDSEPQTNEEWFCQLPTEEKARWLYDHYVNARADEYYGRQEKTLSEYQKWLVSVHRKIDGTKID